MGLVSTPQQSPSPLSNNSPCGGMLDELIVIQVFCEKNTKHSKQAWTGSLLPLTLCVAHTLPFRCYSDLLWDTYL